MPEPRDYPTVRYYADGRFVLVETPAAYVALEPGHADNPSGPFDAVPPYMINEGPVFGGMHPTPASGWREPPGTDRAAERAVWRELARTMHDAGHSKQAIAQALGVSPRTVGRLL